MIPDGNERTREVRSRPGGMTLAEIAKLMGVSPKRVYQIEQRALAKCRKKFAAMRLSLLEELSDSGEISDRL